MTGMPLGDKGVVVFTRCVTIMHGGIVLESAPLQSPRFRWYVTGEDAIGIDGGPLAEGGIEVEMRDRQPATCAATSSRTCRLHT
ncbi:hypothetical protein [Streptomyces chartreusis]|uniref:hypothetical protein n=1 Tax=Streptomyces chartreusis TaxID=1969 RepID=UPI0036C6CD71